MNIESEHINAASRTKIYHSTLIFLCFRQYLDKKVGKSCPEFSFKLPLCANHGSASDWPLIWHYSTDYQIRALDQSIKLELSAPGRVYTKGHRDIDLLKVSSKDTVHVKKA